MNAFKHFFIRFVAPTISAVLILSGIRVADTAFFPPVTNFDVLSVTPIGGEVVVKARLYKPEYRAVSLYRRRDAQTFTRPWGWSTVDLKIPSGSYSEAVITSRHSCYGDAFWWHSTKLAAIKINHFKAPT